MCAQIATPATFKYGEEAIRGAAAVTSLEPGFICHIGEADLLSIDTVRATLGRDFLARQDLASLHAEAQQPVRKSGDERSLLAVLLLREASRERSALMPYIQTFLQLPERLPTGWDPSSVEGARARSAASPALVAAADADRRSIVRQYAALVPAAVTGMQASLRDGLQTEDTLEDVYSVQRFTELWLAMRTRDFINTLQEERQRSGEGAEDPPFPATFLVPLVDLMNHGGSASNIEVRYDLRRRGFSMTATRRIQKGEELRFAYKQRLCREVALLTYGFTADDMLPCKKK